MSVAFRRDSDEEHREPTFELPTPPGPNFVTPDGLAMIEARVAEIDAQIEAESDGERVKQLKRDLRYWRHRQASAQLAPAPRAGTVGIGSRVHFTLRGQATAMTITGFDEADPAHHRIAFSSPLARALIGGCAGELLDFGREDEAIKITAVD